jgi:hypothetical protein
MYTFPFVPDSNGYTFTHPNDVISVELSGGAPRQRLDKLGAYYHLSCQWVLEPTEYTQMQRFYRGATTSGSIPFNIDLIIERAELETYKAYFVPNTFKLVQQRGLAYIVSAELRVAPNLANLTLDTGMAVLYTEFGVLTDALFILLDDIIDQITNYELPAIL